ncbi:MAG TPA: MFS transporter [Beijerinckiaceae bacterium]|jgi:MFS family permease
MITKPSNSQGNLRAVPRGVWALGFVSLFMDVSSEMIHALLPVYLVAVLGTSVMTVGLIEGAAEATAQIVKVFSGALSDRLGRRKLLAVIGYGLGAVSKPLFPLAGGPGSIFAARFIDRIGKGIRGAPRDALVADLTPPPLRGAAFGLRQSLDTVGAFAGPLLAVALMALSGDDYRLVFWVAVVPAFVAVALLVFVVQEPGRDRRTAEGAPSEPLRFGDLARLGAAYWSLVAVYAVFTLARLTEALLVLRATSLGLAVALVPLVLVVMNIVYALSSYPAGALSDRFGRRGLLAAGLAVLAAADVILAFSSGPEAALLGAAAWGLHMGLTQGVFAALVADAAPTDRRGTAFGVFNLAGGLATLAAGIGAGLVWDRFGAPVTFLAGGALALLAAVMLHVLVRHSRHH